MQYRYTVLLERGETEDVWVATIPTLPGCMTQGATVDEALARAQEAIEGHVEALVALGEPVPIEVVPPIVTTVDVTVPEPAVPVGAGAPGKD
jgi:predicted RNase H-like HicB family nuclease